MSTRSQIAIYEKETDSIDSAKVLLYRHSDGMPESVLPDIKPFLVEFNKVRGIDDVSYCLARLTQHLTNQQAKYLDVMYQRMGKTGSTFEKESYLLGYGIMDGFAGGIEYFYHVSPTAIKVYGVAGENPDSWKLLKRVALAKSKANEGKVA